MGKVHSNAEPCPHCGLRLIQPRGKESDVLIVGEGPNPLEVNMGLPFMGEAADILEKELNRAGLSLNAVRSTNLWGHAVPATKEAKTLEFDFHFNRLLPEIRKAKYILLCGSELVPLMLGHKVSQIAGLVYTELDTPTIIKWLVPGQVVVATYNPAICLNTEGVVGDFRFSIERFGNEVKKGRKK